MSAGLGGAAGSLGFAERPASPAKVWLGLGANVGDACAALRSGVAFLTDVGALAHVTHVSSLYRSAAMLPEGAPPEWDMDFVNAALEGVTTLSPPELLRALKQAERAAGRLDRGRWGPRELDLDLLVYESRIGVLPELTLPHPGMKERAFVMIPLAEIAPEARHPEGKTFAELAGSLLPDSSLTCLGPFHSAAFKDAEKY